MQLPARIGKYELQQFLGGGMSHVYKAQDTVIGRTVAVKILTEAGCEDAEAKARFLAEARMAGNLSHDNILGIYDFGEDDQHHPYMVMEFLRGEDLRHAIKDEHTGDLPNKLRIALQLGRALEYIHSQKIIHRDIKPENVHITTTGVVKLMDFGIAKTEGLAMTRAGYVLGTPYYMAPEQVTGEQVTDQVDIYSFGVLLFELVTGVKPINADTVERIFYSILNEPLNLEPLRQSGAPQSICALVGKCTAKTPAERPQGFAPVCAELEKILAGLGGSPAPASKSEMSTSELPQARPLPAPKPARPQWLVPAVVLALIVAAMGLFFALRQKPAPVPAVPTQTSQFAPTISTPTGEMLLVAEGPFLFGEKKESISLPAFYIDKTEVTNGSYRAFTEATARKLPASFPTDKPDYPVVNVSILDAQAYARWAGKRLPTGREWEKAARGADGRLYPWGSDADKTRANVGTKQLRPATDFPSGASPSGALQMVGNVWELVDQLSTPSAQAIGYFKAQLQPAPKEDEPWYTIRGESFEEPDLVSGAVWDWTTVPARWKNPNIGFRCVKDAK